MGRRRRRKKEIFDIEITGIADKGKAVGRDAEGKVCFVDGAVPGDIVDVLILRKKKGFGQGIVTKFKSYSDDRVEPVCNHFGVCGGCKWQNLDYKVQIEHKQKTVSNAIRRIGGQDLDTITILPILAAPSITQYRNKLEYSFSNKRWLTEEEVATGEDFNRDYALGFHRPGAFDKIVDIQNCYLQDSLTDDIRNHIRAYSREHKLTFYDVREHKGMMRNVILRNNAKGEWMVIVVFAQPNEEQINGMMDSLMDKFPQIVSLYYVVNQKLNDTILDQKLHLYHGSETLGQELNQIKYEITPKSFFQTNTTQAINLFNIVVDFCDFNGTENVYDLYTGLGSIALYIANNVKQVVGVEEVVPAIEDAIRNSKLNDIDNCIFYAGDVIDVVTEEFANKHGKPDIVITDPPRAGMHKELIDTLLKLSAPKIVYVSCNVATQARDISILQEKYKLVKMQAVDMFPHTSHVENVALLELV